MQAVTVAVLLFSLAVTFASASRVCGNVYVWRNDNMTCPSTDTVCADVFETTRNWYNGTTCEEKRILHNCKCPGNQICPTSDSSHMLYASRRQMRYTCQSACSLPWCATSSNLYPMTTVQNGPNFGRRSYNKIGCRCPGHHSPDMRAGRRRTVRMLTHRWDREMQTNLLYYRCSGTRGNMDDPCTAPQALRRRNARR